MAPLLRLPEPRGIHDIVLVEVEMTPPACNCARPDGAHDEKCAHIKHVRFSGCEIDTTIPPRLLRKRDVKPSEGVFD